MSSVCVFNVFVYLFMYGVYEGLFLCVFLVVPVLQWFFFSALVWRFCGVLGICVGDFPV